MGIWGMRFNRVASRRWAMDGALSSDSSAGRSHYLIETYTTPLDIFSIQEKEHSRPFDE